MFRELRRIRMRMRIMMRWGEGDTELFTKELDMRMFDAGWLLTLARF
jgi:hypothetical protein